MTRLFATTAAALALTASAALADAEAYALDPDHSAVWFTWSHVGFSTTPAMFTNFEGEIMFDADDPANSSVTASVPTNTIMTIPRLYDHLMSDDFFGANSDASITFESTSIEVTGEDTALITGDLTANGVTNEVVLDATLNQRGDGPSGDEVIGISAETTLMRSDYGLDRFVPFVGDELSVMISIEASPAEDA